MFNMYQLIENGHLTEEAICMYADFLNEDKQNILPDEMVEHVEDCLKCKQRIFELSNMVDEINFHNAPKIYSKRKYSYYKAAIIVIGLTISGLYLIFNKTIVSDKQIAKRVETNLPKNNLVANIPSNNDVKTNVIEDRYKKSPYAVNEDFEGFCKTNLRGSFKLIGPTSEVFKSNETIEFKWENAENKPNNLTIYNNIGRIILSKDSLVNEFVYQNKLKLGLYYWKIYNNDEMLYMGKFTIRK